MLTTKQHEQELQQDRPTALIRIRGVHKSFGLNQVLRGFDLELHDGENLVIIGQSGSGKSVLIKCLVGLETPDAGTVEILGRDLLQLLAT